jgi:hypothetical protein
MFDVTIVTQSFLYRPHPPARPSQAFGHEITAAEEEGLMQADHDDVEETCTTRRRLTVTTEETDVRG